MKVFRFDLNTDYGDGLAIIAANNKEEAENLSHELPSGLGYWQYVYEIKDLIYKGDPRVIEYEYYQE